MLAHGPHVASWRNWPGRSESGAFSVSGTLSVDGGAMPKSCSVCWNELSLSIGERSTSQRPDSSDCATVSVNIQRWAMRLAVANWPGKAELRV